MEQASKKIPYEPSKDYRYELSEDDISRRRWRELMRIFKKLQTETPVPISFCFLGSLTKGKVLTPETAEYADIDLVIMYDKEEVNRSNLSEPEIRNNLRGAIQEELKKVKDDLKLKLKDTIDIRVEAIDSSSISHEVDSRLPYYEIEKSRIWFFTLANYFTLSIGSAVEKYRNKFLLELSRMDDTQKAHRAWDLIREGVERVERRDLIPDKIRKQFPQTLEEALSFYGVVSS